jgi:succinoglycan biosynthesis protein ExoV
VTGILVKLFVYKGAVANFGDELNEWLVPKIFPGLLDDDPSRLLLAIGSILYDHHPEEARKIVFGSGYGGYTAVPKLDRNWDIRCVRGPLTAKALRLPMALVAGDTAILIRDYYSRTAPKPWPVSFIPHFQSVARGHWQAACRLANIHFIDPRSPVDDVLQQISWSGIVVTEAMHGAIVADALRVPWIAIKPVDRKHHLKWHDWAGALDLDVRFQAVAPTSMAEWLALRDRQPGRLVAAAKRFQVAKLVEGPLVLRACRSLANAAKAEPQLSSDSALEKAAGRLRDAAATLAKDYRRLG